MKTPEKLQGHTYPINSNKFVFQIQYVLHIHSNDFVNQPKSQPCILYGVCVCMICNFNVNFHIFFHQNQKQMNLIWKFWFWHVAEVFSYVHVA